MSKILTPSGSILTKSLTSNHNRKYNHIFIFFLFIELSSKTHRHMSKVIRRARQMGKFIYAKYLALLIVLLGILPYMYRPKVTTARSTINQ